MCDSNSTVYKGKHWSVGLEQIKPPARQETLQREGRGAAVSDKQEEEARVSRGGASELGVLAWGCLGDACPRRTRAHLSQLCQRPSNGEHTSPQVLISFPFKEPGLLGGQLGVGQGVSQDTGAD